MAATTKDKKPSPPPAQPAQPKPSEPVKKPKTVADIFESMEYGPAPEADNVAQAWLEDHDRAFGLWINNKWVKPAGRKTYTTKAPATGDVLATTTQGVEEDVNEAVAAAKTAYGSWSTLPGHVRARHIYSISRHVQKHHRLIAVVESLDNGKPIRETRDSDVPIVARHLYHYAGWAQLADTEMAGWKSVGVVGGIVPWNFPLMLLVWKIAPALAMGNTVVLKPATYTRLSALLLAEICGEAGLPPGVFNVVTGGGAMGSIMAAHPDVDKVAFTGSTQVGQTLRRLTAGTGKKLSLELGGKSPVIVFESADLDSVAEGVIDAIWFNQGQVCSAGSRLLIQEPVYEKLMEKLKLRLKHFRLGPSLDKCMDMGPVVDESQYRSVKMYVDEAKAEGAEVYQAWECCPEKGLYYPPTIISNVNTSSKCVYDEIFGPVLVVMPFRTTKEAVALGNNTIYGLGASVWTEKLPLAMEVALLIKAGSVWINAHNLFDAAAGFGGYRQSGYGRDGGKEGLYEYVRPSWEERPRPPCPPEFNYKKFGETVASRPSITRTGGDVQGRENVPTIDHTYKMYYGGKQQRPDAPYSRPVTSAAGHVMGHVGEGNRKDVRNAVAAAHAGAPGWGKRAAHNRAQIMFYMAENLEMRRAEFGQRLSDMTGKSLEDGLREVDLTINRLFHWAAYADKYGGTVQETQLYGATVKIHEPVGVIGIACPDEYPLLGFVSLFAPAVVRANCVVIVPSQKYPLAALDLYQVFDTSDLPAGVVNILTGDRDHLTKYIAEHQDVQSMWYHAGVEGSRYVEWISAENVKRTWVSYGLPRDWADDHQGQGEEFLYQSVQSKNLWIPMGDSFAN